MELIAITFNHDPTSSRTSALNVRRNGTRFVTVPEWQRGQIEPSRVAYSITSARGHVVTVGVRLLSPERAGRTAEIRARPTPASHINVGHQVFGGSLLRAIWDYHAGALGLVSARTVAFDADGDAEFVDFELLDPPFRNRGVGVYNVSWTWDSRNGPGQPWTPFAVTSHRVYGLIDVPTAPWVQLPYDAENTQLPWTDVLDRACLWTASLRDRVGASAAVTFAVFGQGATSIGYSCFFGAPPNYSADLYVDCTAFLERLAGGRGNGRNVNCSDCASMVSTFANAVGCDLWQSQMFDMNQSFPVNPAQLIGQQSFRAVCGTGQFAFHEVAWTGDCSEEDLVFDACLADVYPGTWMPIVPAAIEFGHIGQLGYRQLLATPIGQLLCRPQPQSRRRRFVI
jgi:hypothetical protein